MQESSCNPLLTDLYQLTMLQGYFDAGMADTAVFEFFVRRLPANRGFLIAAGLEQVLQYLETLQFSSDELEWLARCGRFSGAFIDSLAELRFTGDVHAMPEGSVFFPNEPILRIIAPIPVAQFVESRVINLLHFQTLIASKAARCALAAPGKLLIDFGLRRAHGAEAGLLAARASYIAGFAGSSTVLAEQLFGVPAFGTMAHSFVQAHDDEREAFLRFAAAQPNNLVLLIDTYDTEAGARKVVEIAPQLAARGVDIRAVRLDSGDLAAHASAVRRILDRGGLTTTRIFCSGGLDEYIVRDLLQRGAPIDGFGIGTAMDTSADAPYLDCAYKLQEYAGVARRKRSEGKATWPGRKQVFRQYDGSGIMHADVLTLESDTQPGEPLLQPAMRAGQRIAPAEPLASIRARAQQQLARIPSALREFSETPTFPVHVSPALETLARQVDARQQRR